MSVTTRPRPGAIAAARLVPGTATDALALTAIALAALALCWTAGAPFWLADVLIFVPPLAYLCLTHPPARAVIHLRFVVKAVVFCVVFFAFIGIRYGGWTAPSVLPRLFDTVPIEQVLWCVLAIPLTLAVNQRFFATNVQVPRSSWNRPLVQALFLGGLALAVIPPLRALMQGHVYLKIGLVIYPLLLVLAIRLHRGLARELIGTGIVFAIFNLGFELLAMKHGYWGYSGEYVGWVTVAGYRFPIEELLFIVLLSSPGIVAVHAMRWNWKGLRSPVERSS